MSRKESRIQSPEFSGRLGGGKAPAVSALLNSGLWILDSHLAKRHRAERRFRAYGLTAIGFAGLMLVLLLVSILGPGVRGFSQHRLRLDINTTSGIFDPYQLMQTALLESVTTKPGDRPARHQLLALAGSFAAFDVMADVPFDAYTVLGSGIFPVWVPLASNADLLLKGTIDRQAPAAERPLTDRQVDWLNGWEADQRIRTVFNRDFFMRGDSRSPEAAGFLGSIVGSLLTLCVCMALALPIAIAAAITLEEFAPKTRVAEWLEVLINNLAAVPSILYGLLGLSVFLQALHLPRGSALAGGLTLSMLILPVMIIAARAAIRAVPPSMRQAATALGATKLQVVRHHVLPYALPGIMTGTILAVARALGETAPLLMIGMVAFVADIPRGFTDAATAMPVEIYLWASSPELGFVEKTSSGILVLLLLLLLLNLGAIIVRNRSQKIWH